MGRETEIKQLPVDAPQILPAKAMQIEAAQDALAVQSATAQALAIQLGYEGSLAVGALEDGIRFYQQRTAEACLQLGKRLVLLKEVTVHGEFQSRLELLGIEYGAAKRFMGVASKFSKGPTSALLKAANNQSKLIELLVLDDSEISELDEGGTARGLTVDDVANMGVRELRAALRESRAEGTANQTLIDNKNAKIDKLEREKKRIQAAPPSDVQTEILHELSDFAEKAIGSIQGGVRKGFDALVEHHVNHGGDSRQVMAGYVAQLQQVLNELRDDFNLPDAVADGTPAWQVWADAQDDATPAKPENT